MLGVNGAGKPTLMKIMAGEDTEFNGDAWAAEAAEVGILKQEPDLNPDKDVYGNVLEGMAETHALLQEFEEISAKFSEPMDEDEMTALIEKQGELQEKIDAAGGWDLERKLEIAMDALRCPPKDADVSKLSGGERRRVALCRLLLRQPDLLLLDEPTNHLDAESVAKLEHHLEDYEGTVVAVTHDRYFLDNVAGWILELDRGRGIPFEGNYSGWLEQKQKRIALEEKAEKARQKTVVREREWIQASPRARQAKTRHVSRPTRRCSRRPRTERRTLPAIIPPGPRLGDLVIEAKGLNKGFGDRLLIEGLDFKIPPGAIVGIIGANGAGKTTLFRMITGEEKPDFGTLRLGDTVELGYVDQVDALADDKTVWEEISNGEDIVHLGDKQMQSRAYCGAFNFRGRISRKVGQLSGGERNRVHLAKMLKTQANVLLLDEPTNDLDVDTLRALEDALLDFAGCVMVISHDRWFSTVSAHIIAFEGDSQVTWFEGNYDDYEEDRKRRLGDDAANPRRIKYKPLVRS